VPQILAEEFCCFVGYDKDFGVSTYGNGFYASSLGVLVFWSKIELRKLNAEILRLQIWRKDQNCNFERKNIFLSFEWEVKFCETLNSCNFNEKFNNPNSTKISKFGNFLKVPQNLFFSHKTLTTLIQKKNKQNRISTHFDVKN
jgi:hypothetical protein